MKAIIVQGCKTDHGGVVLQGHSSISVSGIGMAAKGYMVACPKCKGVFPISEGAENFILPDGNPVALATMKTACGASLLPSSFLVIAEPSSPFGAQLTGNPNDEDEETTPPPVDRSGRFQLVDQNTGEPIANRRVRVTMGDGTSTIYVSDDQGFTDWIYTPSEQDVHLHLVDELNNG
ncbi:PAAR domain-containing protein (plasmid) [Acinetobacter baumannii]|uniref:PAAR domain-containing protein n=1 Tax=Acinetobacter baumannii TaxID=470 RepID=UPI0023405636|nr:PAAR domain-containing protein [Acinetobacter baumannii]MDC4682106.1 PAAR domain-containing protein [Acinetobacter baumannii]MDC4689446.1 PAAR domain-containing protein [Acinetobacter baumannii]MDC4721639.1 PAAR domain-containing protein [Acinetobacter baumannii]